MRGGSSLDVVEKAGGKGVGVDRIVAACSVEDLSSNRENILSFRGIHGCMRLKKELTTPSSSTALNQSHSSSSSENSPLKASLQIGHGLEAFSGSEGWTTNLPSKACLAAAVSPPFLVDSAVSVGCAPVGGIESGEGVWSFTQS